MFHKLRILDMNNNVGSADKIIRIIIGLVIGGLGIYFQSWWGLIGLIPILTAIFGFCPLYSIIKVNTCKKS